MKFYLACKELKKIFGFEGWHEYVLE